MEHSTMETNELQQIIDRRKAEALKETKKNRLVFRILSIMLLAVSAFMIGYGIDFLIRVDKLTGGLILGAGILLLASVIVIKVFTEKKMALLIEKIEQLDSVDIAVGDEENTADIVGVGGVNITCTRTGTADSHAIFVIDHSGVVAAECLTAVIHRYAIFEHYIPRLAVGIKTIIEREYHCEVFHPDMIRMHVKTAV